MWWGWTQILGARGASPQASLKPDQVLLSAFLGRDSRQDSGETVVDGEVRHGERQGTHGGAGESLWTWTF